jgi:hypothetical protein
MRGRLWGAGAGVVLLGAGMGCCARTTRGCAGLAGSTTSSSSDGGAAAEDAGSILRQTPYGVAFECKGFACMRTSAVKRSLFIPGALKNTF